MTTADTRRAQSTPAASATFAVGDLVRIANPRSWYAGMTGQVESIGPCGALVSLSTRHNEAHTFALSDLVAVERGGR